MTRKVLKTFWFILAILMAGGFSLLPFLWFVSSSFKSPAQITAIPPQWLPDLTLESFRSAVVQYHILRYLKKLCDSRRRDHSGDHFLGHHGGLRPLPAAKAVGPSDPHGRPGLRHVPSNCGGGADLAAAAGPWLAQHLSGIDPSLCGHHTPACRVDPYPLFREIPGELENAALVDGCTRLGALVRVVLPLSVPGLFTASILCFIYAWNEFSWPCLS